MALAVLQFTIINFRSFNKLEFQIIFQDSVYFLCVHDSLLFNKFAAIVLDISDRNGGIGDYSEQIGSLIEFYEV